MATQYLSRALLCAALAASPAALRAQAAGSDAVAKARLVTTFARFVQWPAGTFAADDTPLQLCVAQDSPAVADAFRRQAAGAAAGRPLQLVLLAPRPGAERCHLLYIDDSAPRRAAPALPQAEEPVLTMAQIDGFASGGGMVEVVVVNDALRFDVNLAALQRAGIAVRAGALKLAREVLRK
ncbi:YfiR family protein [Aquincola sp. J276]|uniref:YfiR family protein n=1 Tax=Aquincola sp. J276 TaxID=2898432 RepID=UPI002150F1F1|nr:YfiR family protein [Aquincola sp. J276]MCR5864211.1 YfiR family protein [Aquincola sp. J276]